MTLRAATTPVRRIGVCIDDVGLHPGITEAAAVLGAMGRVSALSCMSQATGWPAAARTLKPALDGRVDFGLHLNFTEPCSGAGTKRSLKNLIAVAYARALDPVVVRDAIRRQLHAFENAIGAPPDFVDGHQHVHQLPVIREALVGELTARYGTRMPWLRHAGAPRPVLGAATPLADRLKERVITALGANALRKLARDAGISQNGHLLGVYGFTGALEAHVVRWGAWCSRAGDGDLLMCHPAAGCATPDDPIASARRMEFEALCSERVEAALREHTLDVVRLSACLRPCRV